MICKHSVLPPEVASLCPKLHPFVLSNWINFYRGTGQNSNIRNSGQFIHPALNLA